MSGPSAPRRVLEDPVVRILRALRPDPLRTAAAVLAGAGALGSAIALMGVSGWLISRAAQQPPVLYLQVAVVATRTFGISRGVLRYTERLISHDVALRGVVQLREQVYRRLASADPAVVAGLRRGDLLARTGADVDTVSDLVVRSILPFAVAWTTLAATTIAMIVMLPGAGALVAVALVIAAVVVPWRAGRAAWVAELDGARARAQTSIETHALVEALPELCIAGAADARLAAIAQLDTEVERTQDAAAGSAARAAGAGTLATGLAMVGSLALAVAATRAGRLDEVMVAVVTLTPLAAAEAVAALPAAATTLVRARAAAERVLELLDAEPAGEARSPRAGRPVASEPAARAVRAIEVGAAVEAERIPHLRADGLACGWPGREPVLTGFDLDLAPGRRVAVVGPSGTGKTTLLLTLAGLLPPLAGAVQLDGVDLADVPESRLRRTVSYTAEDAHIFTTTLRENLRVADPGADDQALRAALARAGLGPWVAGLPAGLDTMISSGAHAGREVSGGERRRVLLARADLTGAGVLLLDEPAEHLDPAIADRLVTDLLSSERSLLLVTHRLRPLAAADEVILLDGGRVVARGRHEQLVAARPGYAAALATQAQR